MRLFPLLLLIMAASAAHWPAAFRWASGWIVPLLMVVMFGMGLTLQTADFKRVLHAPHLVFIGVILHYTVMPATAWLLIHAMTLDPMTATGVALVGSTSAGTASNVIAYLGGGNLALSVTMTALSTLMATVLMPLLVWVLVGARVPVPAGAMCLTVLQIAILPVLAGMLCRWASPGLVRRVQPLLPLCSAVVVVLIVAVIMAMNADRLTVIALPVMWVVVAHNAVGLFAGYTLARRFGAEVGAARTIAVEVGMQNSGLAVALALQFFGVAAALPGALFSVWHNISGSLLASVWSRQRVVTPPEATWP